MSQLKFQSFWGRMADLYYFILLVLLIRFEMKVNPLFISPYWETREEPKSSVLGVFIQFQLTFHARAIHFPSIKTCQLLFSEFSFQSSYFKICKFCFVKIRFAFFKKCKRPVRSVQNGQTLNAVHILV